jgi:hypothetical protein
VGSHFTIWSEESSGPRIGLEDYKDKTREVTVSDERQDEAGEVSRLEVQLLRQ